MDRQNVLKPHYYYGYHSVSILGITQAKHNKTSHLSQPLLNSRYDEAIYNNG